METPPDVPAGRRLTLYALVLVGLYLTYLVLSPFITALAWAALFAIVFHTTQTNLQRRMGPNGAAVVTTLIVALAIVAPVAFVIAAMVREAPQAIAFVKASSQTVPGELQQLWDAIRSRSPVAMPESPSDAISVAIQRVIAFLSAHSGDLLSGSFGALGTLGAMLFALFFLVRDGDAISRGLRERLPFSDEQNARLMTTTRDLVKATFGAGLMVAAAQGAIGGVAFWLLGLGAPAFWGVVTALCALVPVVGAAIVWVPASLGLLLSGATTRGVLMLLVGVFGISLVDNWLRPLLLAGKTSLSGLVVFFGLLGGAAAFGLIGLVIGPIIIVVTAELVESLRRPL